MANILNIDTSSNLCSVAISKDGEIVTGFESTNKMDHSVSLAPFIEKCLESLKENNEKPEAVSVSNGPGSYTGLRIGLSMAKGIAYALNIPLITLSSLEIMAVRALFSYPELEGDELIVPMIDARRMEVYTCAYECSLNKIIPEEAMILDEDSLKELCDRRKVLFIGDGTTKFNSLYKGTNAIWLGEKMPHAKYMPALSEKYFREKNFSDLAYTVPYYLKEYKTTLSKKRL